MKFANKPAIIASLMFFFIKSFHIATAIEDAATPLVTTSDQEKRLLSTDCEPFTHPGSPTANNADNWKTADGITSLNAYCSVNNCCRTGTGGVNADRECINWNTAVEYKICPGACKDATGVCQAIANGSNGGGKVVIHSNACTNGISVCAGIGVQMEIADIEIFSGACVGIGYACNTIGSSTLTRIVVPANECHEASSSGSYGNVVGKCFHCGKDSIFEGTLVASDSCCAENGDHAETDYDVACNYTPPPEEPNPCKNINCSNRGKCQVLSKTDAECKCENTFIQSENKLDCICPSDYEFNANANRCFPITEAPSKSPTSFPTVTSSASPSQEPTEDLEKDDEDLCEDDVNSTFTLDNGNIVDCKWILKNKNRRSVRKAKYCVREEIINMCPKSCGTCSA
ncbi:predicted protein [Chaetoceros tenuissimus]|uniref:ShKT domain-containing protein n=1 Tax=Chaetoceros tenuissimus TaxID=426638 RepID=A0AAD3D315_9STRA|nr:predicted protein [Chaetoceros tenuissimus]